MTASAEITSEERDALYEQVLVHLSSVDDLRIAFQAEDFDGAERLALEFGDELRLMQDLGWGYAPVGATVKLTMAPEQLHRVFSRLRSDIEMLEADEQCEEAEAESEEGGFRERAKRVTEACERVLSVVSRTPPALLDEGG